MHRQRASAELLNVGALLYEHRFVVGLEGNLSARLDDGHFLTTPAGRCKGFLDPSELVLVDGDGAALGAGRPSTEFGMHLAIYAQRPDVDAIVHAHPAYCTAFAAAGRGLTDCILPEMIVAVGKVPVSEYATPSTPAVAAAVRDLAREHDAVLLRNHGIVVAGEGVMATFHKLESIERWAEVQWLAAFLGGATPLSSEQVAELRSIRSVYGISRAIPDCLERHSPDAAASRDLRLERLVAEEIRRQLG